MNDISFSNIEKSDLFNYADYSTLYAADKSVLRDDLKFDFLNISKWFHDIYMIFSPDKCYFVIVSDDKQTFYLICQDSKVKHSPQEKKLG